MTGPASLEARELELLFEELQGRPSPTAGHDLIAFLVTDVNDSKDRYDIFGPDHKKEDRKTLANLLVKISARYNKNAFYAGHCGHDMEVLSFQGSHAELTHITAEIKRTIDRQVFEDHPKGKVSYTKRDGTVMQHDPTMLTIRIGAAYELHGQQYSKGMLARAIETSKDAKTIPGQILIVQYI